MGNDLKLGRVAGISIGANVSVLAIGVLVVLGLAAGVLPEIAPGHGPFVYWIVGVLGAAIFFASLLLHELAHAVVAQRNGMRVESVTLWLFGGVAQLSGKVPGPGAQLRIAIAGPATSGLLAAVFIGAAFALDPIAPAVVVGAVAWLGLINAVLAVFNLLPGAPLDGGRVLTAALWKLRGDERTARRQSARAGRVVGALLIAAGVAEMLFLGGYGGFWTIAIGFMISTAAKYEEQHADEIWTGDDQPHDTPDQTRHDTPDHTPDHTPDDTSQPSAA
jgi:Zn-dependent protease